MELLALYPHRVIDGAGVADITHPYSTVSITCVGLTLRVTVEATTEKKVQYFNIIVRAKV